MDIENLILKKLEEKDKISVSDIVKITGFTRAYINRFFQTLRNEGKIILIGKARRSIYVKAAKDSLLKAKRAILTFNKKLKNFNLSEDAVLEQIKRESGIFIDLPENIIRILDYGFTEMLNNAIEHSLSKIIEIKVKRTNDLVNFIIVDFGIGIFNNIRQKKDLKNELEAIQDLLKGKQTTMPSEHSGEGIFFTSKIADAFIIESSNKKLIFNNLVDDIFIQDIKSIKGTKIIFTIAVESAKEISKIFHEYAGESYEFSKTKVNVKLYKMGDIYISRSQARRIVSGLDKFKTVILDFNRIKAIGQSFADEIFSVWQNNHPQIEIIAQNTNENMEFMISRAINREGNEANSQSPLLKI